MIWWPTFYLNMMVWYWGNLLEEQTNHISEKGKALFYKVFDHYVENNIIIKITQHNRRMTAMRAGVLVMKIMDHKNNRHYLWWGPKHQHSPEWSLVTIYDGRSCWNHWGRFIFKDLWFNKEVCVESHNLRGGGVCTWNLWNWVMVVFITSCMEQYPGLLLDGCHVLSKWDGTLQSTRT